MRTDYNVTIRESSRELTARERIKFKDVSAAVQMDTAVTLDHPITIQPVGFVVLDVHNEKSEDKDYVKYVIEDANGTLYATGSDSFINSFMEIDSEMNGEPYEIQVYKRESKNYKGKHFLTCTIV